MAIKFIEAGGDADYYPGTNPGLWSGQSGLVDQSSSIVHGNHKRSIKFYPNSLAYISKTIILADAGSRISFYFRIVALPTATAGFVTIATSAGLNIFNLRITSGGILQLWNNMTTAQIGSNGSTLSTGVWYRISIAYTITSTSVNRIELFLNGSSDISVTNATLTRVVSSQVSFGNLQTDTTLDTRMSDFYIDDSSSLTDTGDIWVTAKRPVSNGTLNEFTTQIGASGSGYGSGHSPQVNERISTTTNGWSISTTTKKTEQFTIEAKNVGDIDITNATIIDYMGWITASVDSTSNSPVHNIIINNVATAVTLSTSVFRLSKVAGSSTYPTGNTDIGMDAQYTTTPHLSRLFECGILVAYIPRGSFMSFM